ncbi:MAG: hypothetical protein ACRDUA_05455 [Micromonosporaceae bacterium]
MPAVGEQIADNGDAGQPVFVPVLCLAEAYRHAGTEGALMLDLLVTIDNVVVTPVEPDMAPILGGFTSTVGRADIAQVVITAAERRARIMTSERHLVTQILPKEWPIIEL